MRPLSVISLLLAFVAPLGSAQQPLPSTSTGPDNPSEFYKLQHSCFAFKTIGDCADQLFTGQPIHIAVGSIAPQNGFAAGLAYVGHKTTTSESRAGD